ncbi:MAG: hypothetical protein WA797_02840 [Acidimicrobiales bacterium]
MEPPTAERLARQIKSLDAAVQLWFVMAQRLRQALVDERGRLGEDT